jgi:hypothetical protein
MELPEASCNIGHQVYLEVYNITKGVDSSHPILQATGKVKEVEGLPEEKLRVTVDLVQFEEKNWLSLIELFSKRQREILRFLEQVKG